MHALTGIRTKHIPILIAFVFGFWLSTLFDHLGRKVQPCMCKQNSQLGRVNESANHCMCNVLKKSLDEMHFKPCPVSHSQDTVYAASFQMSLPENKPDSSSIRVSSVYGMNFATARNICAKPDGSKNFFLYSDNIPGVVLRKRSGFDYGWKFHIMKSKIPSSATFVSGKTIILSPAYIMHVTHFAESSIPLWHTFSRRTTYPVHSQADRIFLKQSKFSKELEWNRKILIFLSWYANNATIVDSSSFESSSLICFEEAGLVGMGLHEYGFFANQGEAQTFRQSIVRFYGVTVLSHTSLLYKSR